MESRRHGHSPCGTSVGLMLAAAFVFLIRSIALSLDLTGLGCRQGDLTEVLDIQREISGGRVRIAVPQHITETFESHPLTQQLQGKRVPQTVKACRLNLDFGGSHSPCESAIYSVWAKRTCGRTLPKKTDDGTLRLDMRSASGSPARHQPRPSAAATSSVASSTAEHTVSGRASLYRPRSTPPVPSSAVHMRTLAAES